MAPPTTGKHKKRAPHVSNLASLVTKKKGERRAIFEECAARARDRFGSDEEADADDEHSGGGGGAAEEDASLTAPSPGKKAAAQAMEEDSD